MSLTGDGVAGMLWLLAGVSAALALLLLGVYRRVRRESYLHYWAVSWIGVAMAQAAAAVAAREWMAPAHPLFESLGPANLVLLAGLCAGWLQPVGLVLAAVSAGAGRPSSRLVVGVAAAAAVAGVGLAAVASGHPDGARGAAAYLLSPRYLVSGLAAGVFAWRYYRHHHRSHTLSGMLITGFSFAYAVHMLVSGVVRLGFEAAMPFGPDFGLVLSGLLPLGMTVGIVLSVLEAVHALESAVNSVWDVSLDGMRLTDRNGTIVRVNHAFCDLMGKSRTDLEGQPLSCCYLAADSDRIQSQYVQRVSSGQVEARKSSTMVLWNGTERRLDVTNSVVQTPDGPAVLAVFRDETSRHEAELDRKRLEQQLADAQKMEALGRLAGGVAHDFNNLLTVINGYLGLAIDRVGPDAPVREDLVEARQAGERAADLTQQLLAFGRRRPSAAERVDLNALVREADRLLRWTAGRETAIEYRLDWAPLPVSIDPAQVHQILLNLVANARDAMPAGGTITIETSRVSTGGDPGGAGAGGELVMLACRDTGVGMDAEERRRIFEPFFTSKPAGRGTGLGLSTVRDIVVRAGGSVTVESQPGAGTSMCVFLPAAAPPPSAAPGGPALPLAQGAGETILLVEDESDVRKVVTNALRRFGYDVVECASGEDALVTLSRRASPIDLLLTDVVMAGLSGPELAARVRARQPGVRVLYISGHPASAIGIDTSLDPDSAFLQKPFGPESIAAAAQALLRRTRSRGRILLADDDAAVRGFLRRVLVSSGYEVTEAADGKQATTAIRQQPFDLVITDLVMPEQEGLETIAQIRKEFPSMRIIAMSGAFGGRFLQVGERLGANATLTKPVQPQELIATVERVIAASEPDGSAG